MCSTQLRSRHSDMSHMCVLTLLKSYIRGYMRHGAVWLSYPTWQRSRSLIRTFADSYNTDTGFYCSLKRKKENSFFNITLI